ncbi:Zn-ribbon domain-containing OB-fold protein [Kribbella sp. NPDC049227]|uniref:Zn-ribbon domain-containing OB-fold protein n=1 Tax=Kribbella sp. NPDC049227 TaxID=3364113 RepID=UPI00371E2227
MADFPIPDVDDPDYAPFWAGATRGELVLPECAACGTVRWPPRALCRRCYSDETLWSTHEARGTLHTWTVVGHPSVPGFAEVPYAVGIVELTAVPGIRLTGGIAGAPDDLWIGMPLTAVFDRVGGDPGLTVVRWQVPDPSEPNTPEEPQ